MLDPSKDTKFELASICEETIDDVGKLCRQVVKSSEASDTLVKSAKFYQSSCEQLIERNELALLQLGVILDEMESNRRAILRSLQEIPVALSKLAAANETAAAIQKNSQKP